MKTCIIGGRGYIGSALREVIEADSFDMWDQVTVKDYDNVILLAGHSSKPMGENQPDQAWNNNVNNFRKFLKSVTPEQKFIYASSASVYNNIPGVPDETCAEFHPMNMYDLSKYVIDQLALLSDKQFYGLRFCTVNGYSPVLRVDLMLNKMVEDAKNLGKVTIKNGELTRPILGMQDLVRAVKTIIDTPDDHRGLYNLKSFHNHTVREFAEAVTRKFGGEIEDLGNEPHYVFGADTTKFETTYNFKFREDLDTILSSLTKEPKEKVIRV